MRHRWNMHECTTRPRHAATLVGTQRPRHARRARQLPCRPFSLRSAALRRLVPAALRRLVPAVAALTLLAGCRDTVDRSPPQVLYGQTECERCRMIVSEERFAAALVFEDDHRVVKPAFDDVGCLLEYLKRQPPASDYIAYVHDLDTRRWLDASQAHFVHSDTLETPMASGLAAADSPRAAQQLADRYAGRRLRFGDLLEERGVVPAAHAHASGESR